jgi:hypothetical protein
VQLIVVYADIGALIYAMIWMLLLVLTSVVQLSNVNNRINKNNRF